MNYPKLLFRATGIKLRKRPLEQDSPQKAGGSLNLSFCQYAGDEADENSQSGFEFFMKTPTSKELSLANLLLSSPTRQPSTSLIGWPLQPIQEERCEEEDLLSCLQESSVLLQGATPQDVHAYAMKYCLLKNSVEAVQLSLIQYPQFSAWEAKHDPIEKVVPLPDHPQQQELFNSWVELYDGTRPTTVQTPVRMPMFVFESCACGTKSMLSWCLCVSEKNRM